jgi:hypothetical protein
LVGCSHCCVHPCFQVPRKQLNMENVLAWPPRAEAHWTHPAATLVQPIHFTSYLVHARQQQPQADPLTAPFPRFLNFASSTRSLKLVSTRGIPKASVFRFDISHTAAHDQFPVPLLTTPEPRLKPAKTSRSTIIFFNVISPPFQPCRCHQNGCTCTMTSSQRMPTKWAKSSQPCGH